MRILLTLFLLTCVTATAAPQLKVYQRGSIPIRVLYYTEGPLAVDPTDVNKNGIPDRVEDCLTSAMASKLLYCNLLGYPDPLHSGRLPRARFIDIRLDAKVSHTNPSVSFPSDIPNNPRGAGSLTIYTQPKGSARPYSIPHESFHLVQFAATYCSTSWFTEGTARWSQQGLGNSKGQEAVPLDHWPLTRQETSVLFEMKYDASKFLWNRLALLCDNDGEIPRGPVFEELMAMKYVDGSPVLKNTKLVGWRLMRDVFLQIEKLEDNKRLRHDDDAILGAVEKAAAKYLPKQMPAKSVPAGADVAAEKAKK